MKLLNGIFYQFYWAKFSKGFSNRLYQDSIGCSIVIPFLFCSATIPFIILLLQNLSLIYDAEPLSKSNYIPLFISYYLIICGGNLAYFLFKKRYKTIISDAQYNQRYYKVAAILYPILCILFMFLGFMMMCFENRVRYGVM